MVISVNVEVQTLKQRPPPPWCPRSGGWCLYRLGAMYDTIQDNTEKNSMSSTTCLDTSPNAQVCSSQSCLTHRARKNHCFPLNLRCEGRRWPTPVMQVGLNLLSVINVKEGSRGSCEAVQSVSLDPIRPLLHLRDLYVQDNMMHITCIQGKFYRWH